MIPDHLALVGDAADGYPGIAGIGPVGAAGLLNRHGAIERFPSTVLGDRRELALLFKRLATLRWRGPTAQLGGWTERMEAPRVLERALKACEGTV